MTTEQLAAALRKVAPLLNKIERDIHEDICAFAQEGSSVGEMTANEAETVDAANAVRNALAAFDKQPAADDATMEREPCDRVETVINRSINMGWITIPDNSSRASFAATLRIALDTEVQAGGPYLNNGHNRRAALAAMAAPAPAPDGLAELRVGDFVLRHAANGIWIGRTSGEGGEFATEHVERVIAQFYREQF